MQKQFPFFIIGFLLFFWNNLNQQAFACTRFIYDNECCTSGLYGVFWPSSACNTISGNCNMFGHNCVVCALVFDPTNNCERMTQCSCYYCCETQYEEYCPQGCENCIEDGSGGCRDNNGLKDFGGCVNSATKRSVMSYEMKFAKMQKINEVKMSFDRIDANRDGFISKAEAINYLAAIKQPRMSAEDLAKNSTWFEAMDKNGNKKIEPEEFDRSLGK